MEVGPNRVTERAGVNAARALFEAAGCLFQEVDSCNDFGKDAYVDLTEQGVITGDCIAGRLTLRQKYLHQPWPCPIPESPSGLRIRAMLAR